MLTTEHIRNFETQSGIRAVGLRRRLNTLNTLIAGGRTRSGRRYSPPPPIRRRLTFEANAAPEEENEAPEAAEAARTMEDVQNDLATAMQSRDTDKIRELMRERAEIAARQQPQEEEEEECAICSEGGELVKVECGHKFHQQCICKWLSTKEVDVVLALGDNVIPEEGQQLERATTHTGCPICRTRLVGCSDPNYTREVDCTEAGEEWLEPDCSFEGVYDADEPEKFKQNQHITAVVVPEGVIEVAAKAFLHCRNLKKVSFPSTLREIGKYAFEECESLVQVEFSPTTQNQVFVVGARAFHDCISLKSIDLSNFRKIAYIYSGAFRGCLGLASVVLPKNIVEIAPRAFFECPIKTIEFPHSLDSLGYGAFAKSGLAWVDLSKTKIRTIPKDAFWHCKKLRSVKLPKTAETVGTAAFQECARLSHVVIPSTNTLTKIATRAFKQCVALKKVNTREVTSIERDAFKGCTKLSTVRFSRSLRTIGEAAFHQTRLKRVTIPRDVVSLRLVEGKIFKEKANVTSVAFSPDDKLIVSGSYDKTVRVWNVDSGQEMIKLNGHTDRVNSVAFSPNGELIASGSSDNTVRVWDVASYVQRTAIVSVGEVMKLEGHISTVNSVTFSKDGKFIVSGSNDNTVRVWNVNSGEEMMKLGGHTNVVNSVAFSNDGKCIVSGSNDKTVRVWNVASGGLHTLLNNQYGSSSVTTSNYYAGEEIMKLDHTDEVTSVAFSPDDKFIVSGSADSTVRVWNVASGEEMMKLDHTDEVTSVAFSPDGKSIVSGSLDETVRIWNVDSGGYKYIQHNPSISSAAFLRVEMLKLKHGSWVNSVAFSNDGRRIVSGSRGQLDSNVTRLYGGKELSNFREGAGVLAHPTIRVCEVTNDILNVFPAGCKIDRFRGLSKRQQKAEYRTIDPDTGRIADYNEY